MDQKGGGRFPSPVSLADARKDKCMCRVNLKIITAPGSRAIGNDRVHGKYAERRRCESQKRFPTYERRAAVVRIE
jgi:hypothetical protein